jgi:hypothetical protein
MSDLLISVEDGIATSDRARHIVDDLLRQTAANRAHPFTAINWNAAENDIDPTSPIWLSCLEGPAAPKRWFNELSSAEQSTFAMERLCVFFLAGVEFETGLSAGLLQFAQRPEVDHHTFAYIYEEIIEEAQHSLMFRTFVQRCSPTLIDQARAACNVSKTGQKVAEFAASSPLMFLAGVLCGEEPIDHVQRSYLRLRPDQRHPLLTAVCSLHVTEEARHLRFARSQMRTMLERAELRDVARVKRFMPLITKQMTSHMLGIPDWFAQRWEIPAEELTSPEWLESTKWYENESARKLAAFARSCDLLAA